MTKTQSDCILNGCFIKPMNENIAVLLPVHSPRWVLGIGIRMHWEKCGEILFFSKILCFLEKSLLSFREKSYFFEKKTRFLSHDFSQYVRSRFLIGGCTGKNVEKFCFSPKYFVFVFVTLCMFIFLTLCMFIFVTLCMFVFATLCMLFL